MRKHIVRAMAALLATSLLMSTAAAQEPSPTKPAPRLTTDDVLVRRNTAAVEVDEAAPAQPPSRIGSWARYSPEGMGVSLELPSPPRPFELPLPDAAKNNFASINSMICAGQNLTVMMMHFATKSSVTPQTLRDFTAGFLDGMSAATTNPNVKYDVKPIGASSYSIKATTSQDSRIIEQEGVVKSQGKDIWLLMTMYSHVNGTDQRLGKKVLASVEFP